MYLEHPHHRGGSDRQLHKCRITGITYEVSPNKNIYGLIDRNGREYGGQNGDGEILFDVTARTRGMKIERGKCPACGEWV